MGERPRWHTAKGEIIGVLDGDVIRARGLPYATTMRFSPPLPVARFDAPFDAAAPAPVPPQRVEPLYRSMYRIAGEPTVFDEDCTRLSITLPADVEPGERLPVMVWIHGGSYLNGAGDLDIYDPRDLVVEQRVIVVAVTYRLGLLGYLGRGTHAPANLGLLDQLEALRWIRATIADLGGDADAITLFGESAGADAIAHLMIADGAAGLFHRAILQSPPLGVMSRRGPMVTAMVDAVGTLDPTASLTEVEAAQHRALAAGGAPRFGLRAGMPFGVEYGAAPLPREADLDAAWRAAAQRIDVLIGTNEREGALFVDDVEALRRPSSAPVVGPRVKELSVATLTELVYARPVRRFAHRHHAAGGHGYRYLFSWGVPGNFHRANHTAELPLLLGAPGAWDEAWSLQGHDPAALRRDGATLRALWGRFARTGRLVPQRHEGLIEILPLR